MVSAWIALRNSQPGEDSLAFISRPAFVAFEMCLEGLEPSASLLLQEHKRLLIYFHVP